MDTKPLWKSKTFWSDVVTIGIAICMLSDQYFHTHITTGPYWTHALFMLGAFGIYGRKTADSKISDFI